MVFGGVGDNGLHRLVSKSRHFRNGKEHSECLELAATLVIHATSAERLWWRMHLMVVIVKVTLLSGASLVSPAWLFDIRRLHSRQE